MQSMTPEVFWKQGPWNRGTSKIASTVGDMEAAWNSLCWLGWVIMEAKPQQIEKIDIERVVPEMLENVRAVLRAYDQLVPGPSA